VIRRGKTANPPSEADLDWQSRQQSLLKLSTNSELVVAEKSGHVVPYDEPEVVAEAVRKLLPRLRKR
jgi:pimeloyl-ACP methyl ester carboxylesterase